MEFHCKLSQREQLGPFYLPSFSVGDGAFGIRGRAWALRDLSVAGRVCRHLTTWGHDCSHAFAKSGFLPPSPLYSKVACHTQEPAGQIQFLLVSLSHGWKANIFPICHWPFPSQDQADGHPSTSQVLNSILFCSFLFMSTYIWILVPDCSN